MEIEKCAVDFRGGACGGRRRRGAAAAAEPPADSKSWSQEAEEAGGETGQESPERGERSILRTKYCRFC